MTEYDVYLTRRCEIIDTTSQNDIYLRTFFMENYP